MAVPPYLDADHGVDRRCRDLLDRMSIKMKVGQLFQEMAAFRNGAVIDEPVEALGLPAVAALITDQHMTHFNMLGSGEARAMASWHNALQDAAMETPLQIPVSLSSDPRHGPGSNVGTGMATEAFSAWPEALGLAALRDQRLVEQFADIVRREYLAVGIRVALHPQIDVATEPRWSRTWGTFGDDSQLVGTLGAAYVRGLQGRKIGPSSVSAMVKHFPGNGPVENGEDPHFPYGKRQVYPAGNADAHLAPFRRAIAAGAMQVMPSYGVPIGLGVEEVGCGFNRDLITGVLRESLGFDGVVCTDWGLITDSMFLGEQGKARAWGVEHLSPVARVAKALDAGVDQFGGEHCTELVLELLERGDIPEARIDDSVARLLRQKFALGLFENRHVDVDATEAVFARSENRALGRATQSRSVTVLTNRHVAFAASPTLPLRHGCRIYVVGVDPDTAGRYGTVVRDQADADVSILRTRAPFEPRDGMFERHFHAGSLEFDRDQLDLLFSTMERGPTIVDVFLERPAVLTPLVEQAAALTATFGCSDEAYLDAVFGAVAPEGRLPVSLPRSMYDVAASPTDGPIDSAHALFVNGAGL